jgi:predicted N-acetyltransferase YhbS
MTAIDARGAMQAICIAKICDEVLQVEDLLVAPWNNAFCGSLTREESTLDTSKCLFELAKALEVDQDELTRPGKGVGTLMMHAVYEMAQQLSSKAVVLESNPLAFDFYAKLGMHKTAGKHSAFRYDIEKTMAAPLRDKAQRLMEK